MAMTHALLNKSELIKWTGEVSSGFGVRHGQVRSSG
jgi:hypothetical protein